MSGTSPAAARVALAFSGCIALGAAGCDASGDAPTGPDAQRSFEGGCGRCDASARGDSATRDGSVAADGAPDGPAGVAPDGALDFLVTLESLADYERVAGTDGGTKYLARVDDREPPAPLVADCTFQNTGRFPFHIDFLQSLPGLSALPFDEYSAWVTTRTNRRLWGGDVTYFPDAVHPITGEPGVLGYAVYAADTDVDALTIEEIAEVDRRLTGCIPFAQDLLVFIPLGARQTALLRDADALLAAGITPIPPATL